MRVWGFANVVLVLLTLAGGSTRAQDDVWQNRIRVTAMTYDDGFGLGLKNPAGVWYDRAACEVLVADAGNGRIVIYDSVLTALYSFRHYVTDPATRTNVLGEPQALAINSQGEILIADGRTDILDLVDFRGRLITSVSPGRLLNDSTLRLKTTCLTCDEFDRFYVIVGGGLTRLLVLDRDLQLVRQFGEKGDLPAHFNAPVSVSVHGERVYVGDVYGLPAVKIFDTLGQFLFGFGGHELDRKDLSFPSGVGFLRISPESEYTLVLDKLRQAAKVYTEKGDFVTLIGGYGNQPGLLQYPSGLATDGKSTIYIVEKTGSRLQKYVIQ
jgi:hypothetical protein